MVTLRGQLISQAIQKTPCPACGAKPGETCRDDVNLRARCLLDGQRVHSQRELAWRELICGPRKS